MSYTSVYELFNTKANSIAELRNGHGSGPAIWDYISHKLYNKPFSTFENMSSETIFWASYKSELLDDDEKAVLLSTYDGAFIETEHLIEFAAACKKVHDLILETTRWTWSHFEKIGEIAENLSNSHDYRCKGLAIGCTSICDAWEQEDISNIEVWGVYFNIKALTPEEQVNNNG